MFINRFVLFFVAVIGCLLIAAKAYALPTYTVTNLSSLSGDGSNAAWAINNTGQIVGYDFNNSKPEAFLWDEQNGTQNLGHLNGAEATNAWGINDSGQVVGRSGDSAFIWDQANGLRRLDEVFGVSGSAAALDINNAGQIVGRLSNGHAALWDQNGVTDLGSLSVSTDASTAYAVNELGQVVGISGNTLNGHAFLWDEENGMVDLGLLDSANYSFAQDINNQSQVVGYSDIDSGGIQAFYWDESLGMLELNDMLDSNSVHALGINENGLIVGGGQAGALLWDINAGLDAWNLNDLIDPGDALFGSVFFSQALDINEAGQIVGHGLLNSRSFAFLLTPVEEQGVSEPKSFILFAFFIIGFGLLQRHILKDKRAV